MPFTVTSNASTESMTPDLQRGSFQRKFRSLWFGSSGKKKENKQQLESSSRLKSLSSPSLTAAMLEKSLTAIPTATSDFSIATAAVDSCADDCQCNQICPCCIDDQQNEMDYLQRNMTSAVNNNNPSTASRMTSHTLPRNFTVCIPDSPNDTSVEDKYVFVVSDLDTSHPQLTVRTEQQQQQQQVAQISPPSSSEALVAVRNGSERNKRSDDPDRSLASVIPDRMGSAESQDYLYKSSSASESGRGTLPSETERLLKKQESEQKQEPQYTSVNKKNARTTDCGKESDHHRNKYPQLYVAATRAPMPAVIESESWVSDCSTFQEVVRPSRGSHQQQSSAIKVKKSETAKGSASKSKAAPQFRNDPSVRDKPYGMNRWKSLDSVSCADDITSEFTADISTYNPRDSGLKQDLRTLQLMYDKVFRRLSLANHSSLRNRRKSMGSISTINSLTRTTADSRRVPSARKQLLPDSSSSSSKKIRKIEENVITLAKSVNNLTTELRRTEKLHDQVVSLTKEVSCLQQQISHMQLYSDPPASRSKTDSAEKLYSSVKKQSKISRYA
jgi:hypothetical protein